MTAELAQRAAVSPPATSKPSSSRGFAHFSPAEAELLDAIESEVAGKADMGN